MISISVNNSSNDQVTLLYVNVGEQKHGKRLLFSKCMLLAVDVWMDDTWRSPNSTIHQLTIYHNYWGTATVWMLNKESLHTITVNNHSHVDNLFFRCLFFSAEFTFSKVFCCSFCTTFQYLSKLISPP